MRPRVTPRARGRPDRGGDPLDGLVNLFDLGIVLAVAFLLAALSSLKLSDLLTDKNVSVVRNTPEGGAVIVRRGAKVTELKLAGKRVVGQGQKVGSVFRLADGRVVYVKDADLAAGAAGPTGPTGPSAPTGSSGASPPSAPTPSTTTPGGSGSGGSAPVAPGG